LPILKTVVMKLVKKINLGLAILFLILGFFVLTKIFWLGTPAFSTADENYYLEAALQYQKGNYSVNLEHPPLGKLLILAGIDLWGNNPVGWRVPSLVFGTLGIFLVFLLTKVIFKNQRLAIWAAILLSLDFLWFIHSRTAMLDIFVSTFILATTIFLWQYLQKPSTKRAVILGIFLGLTIAVKWVGLFLVGLIVIFSACQSIFNLQAKFRPKDLIFIFLAATLFYLLPYLFFWQDLSLTKFFLIQIKMARIHLGGLWPTQTNAQAAWSWFLPGRSTIYSFVGGEKVTAIIGLGHPLIFWLWPVVFLALAKETLANLPHKKQLGLFFVLAFFSALFFPWLVSLRPTFLFYVLPTVPFVCLGIAYLLEKIWEQGKWGKIVVTFYLLAVFGLFLLYLPLLSGQPISWQHFRVLNHFLGLSLPTGR